MRIVLYANCQGIGILHFLQKKINAHYDRIEHFRYFDNPDALPMDTIKKADIFIFQFTKSKHGICSTDFNADLNIHQYLKKDCLKIGIPSIYQTSFWPIVPDLNVTVGYEVIKDLKKKYSLQDVLFMYDKGELDFNLKDRFNACELHTKELEHYYLNNKDDNTEIVTVTPFIKRYYRNYRLFLSHCHPTSYIYAYIAHEIINIINKRLNCNISNYDNDIFTHPIVPTGSNIPVTTHSWKDSKYVKRELNVTYVTEPDDMHFKNIIKRVYNSVKIDE